MDAIDSPREVRKPKEEDIPDDIPYLYRIDNGYDSKLGQGFRWGLRDLVDDAVRPFSYYAGSHGALTERLVLYGSDGIGKRHLAIDIINKIIAKPGDDRKVFWVFGHSFEGFVRDYLNIYYDLTGSKLPKGLGVPTSLLKVKHTLEERRQEWLLVIFDLSRYAEDTFSGSRQKLTHYLPERGQIIITSAAMVTSQFEWAEGPPKISSLQVANTAVELCVSHMKRHGQLQYTRDHCPVLNSNDELDMLDDLFGGMKKLTLTVVSATMYLLGCDAAQYSRLIQRLGNASLSTFDFDVRPKVLWDLAMKALWDALADYDAFTVHVLVALSCGDYCAVPLRLLRKLDVFANTRSERLEPALDTLRSLGLATITTDEEPTVRIHSAIHIWIRQRKPIGIPRGPMVISWIKMLPGAIEVDGDPDHYDPEKVWEIFPHIWCVTEAVQNMVEPSQDFGILVFLVRLADCLIADRRHANYAGMITDTAWKFWSRMTSDESVDALRNQYLYVRMKQCRIEALMSVGEQSMAESDLQRVQNACMIQELHEQYPLLRRRTEFLGATVLLEQERFQEVEQALDVILRNPEPGVSPKTVAIRHHLMSQALDHQGISVAAYQYSCCVMSYWGSLPLEERWGQNDFTYLNWVNHHCTLLVHLGKFKGALTFLEALCDAWEEWFPYSNGIFLYRIFYAMILCYSQINYFGIAEQTVIRMLEHFPVADLVGEPLLTALSALCELGICYVRFGHLVQAEAVFKFILAMARKMEADGLVEEDHDWAVDWWAQLLYVLMLQNKHEEVRAVRDEWQTEHHDETFVDGYLAGAKKRHARGLDVYQRAFWAEEDGKFKEFKKLLDGTEDASIMRRMGKMFGSIKWRVKEQCDWASDLDIWEVEKAFSSRVLHLLGQDMTYYYSQTTALFFEGRYGKLDAGEDKGDDETESDQEVVEEKAEAGEEPCGKSDTESAKDNDRGKKSCLEYAKVEVSTLLGHRWSRWSHPKQRLLDHYWRWCTCRRRRIRTHDIGPYEWHEKRLTLERADYEEQAPSQLTQTILDDYFYTIIEAPVFAPGCTEDCPCRAANLQGSIDYKHLVERRLWRWEEPISDPPEISVPTHYFRKFERSKSEWMPNERYMLDDTNALRHGAPLRAPAPFVSPPASSTAKQSMDVSGANRSAYEPSSYRPGSTWKWMQSELLAGEGPDENYILPNCLYIPIVTITGTRKRRPLWPRVTELRQILITEIFQKVGRWEEILTGADEFEVSLGVS